MTDDYHNDDTATTSQRTPPHSVEAEQSVLGALMLDERAWESVSETLRDNDFYRHDHRLIFRAIQHLSSVEQAIDVVTVAEELEERGQLESIKGGSYLARLVDMTPSIENCDAYAEIVRERSQQRRLIEAASDIMQKAYEPGGDETLTLISDAEKAIAEIAEGNRKDGGPEKIAPILKNTLDQLDQMFNQPDGLTGLTTGFDHIDQRTSGFQKADLVIVAARPSMGKTTFAMNLVENALLASKRPCLVFSMEMPSESIVMRMLSSIGKIDQSRIRSGKLIEEDWPKLSAAVTMLKDLPLYIDDTAALTPQEMRARARKIYRESGDLALIMVDYLQLMQVSGKSEGRTQEISEISRSLKAIAKEFECPVIALSQLNRSLEQRPNKRPVMSDLRESGAIEQDADIIQFIYRDEVYNEDTPEKGVAEIITGKHRNGPIGTDRLAFIGKYTRFENLAHGYDDYGDE
ncbi:MULTISPECIES: replicative DNA helicase [unclassified Oceanobacter]|jgi:replicative DNA helicase|uniref:replicative DNA helicase n=1 Tax=unclassified Oceanobacter TaxID=2620260 RepID=UPI0026E3B926|nr:MULTISPECIES: replicative DNA helicase [unclassified Oceanobacter]MDO6681289.1 replicative DNA helicase [Oceanobacter sp. 5_MG-2023]MDP2505000.1 replicative DNA helicase [Oceanobacter sp. 3_MG-2023]MDP2548571.1 replicative DNA helicase [Oceanobacter sp. 4_MG-2023]MDP2608035.1 replicative DNA helicase [Oceanobacter sp. 1_MG-2023]MDP2611303.1 replicative DNA helicase [Oceanobacter sp. 2_MG-2023]